MLQNRNATLGFIFVTILVDVIGLGIIIPVIPTLIEQLTGEGISEASRYGGWLMFTYALLQFFFAPVLGELSDRYGRRPVLLVALLGLGLDYIFHAFAPTIFWLFVGRILAGICGASFTVATAYIADISTPEKRAQNFGMIGAAFGLGFIIGPVLGGIFAKVSTQAPFLIAAGLSLVNLLYGLFILPESLAPENRRTFDWKRANPAGSLLHLKQYPAIIGLIATVFLIYMAGHSVQATWTYFTKYLYKWDEAMVGYSLGVVGVLVAIVQAGLVRIVVKKLGQKVTILLGMTFSGIGLILFSLASEGWMIYAFLLPYCLGGIAGPTLQGLISNQVPANEQGELQGAITSLVSLTSIISPPLMTSLFYYFTQPSAPFQFPGAAFMAGALFVILSFFVVMKPLNKLTSAISKEE